MTVLDAEATIELPLPTPPNNKPSLLKRAGWAFADRWDEIWPPLVGTFIGFTLAVAVTGAVVGVWLDLF